MGAMVEEFERKLMMMMTRKRRKKKGLSL